MKFLGIDLGWSSGASGLCCLDWQDGRLELVDLRREDDTAAILAWVDTCVAPDESGVIAVDAPTLIPNATGMQLCDRFFVIGRLRSPRYDWAVRRSRGYKEGRSGFPACLILVKMDRVSFLFKLSQHEHFNV